MIEFYRIPALALLSMLLVVFALLYLKTRTTRRLLWLVGWCLATLHQAIETAGIHSPGVAFALANAGMVLAPLMFLGSMSPLGFKRWPKVLYAYVFAVPAFLFAVLISLYPHPNEAVRILLIVCTTTVVYVAILWNNRKNILPWWFTFPFSLFAGAAGLWLTYKGDYFFVLYLAQGCTNLMTGLLFAGAFRRFSPGVIFASAGFFLWSTPVVLDAMLAQEGSVMLIVWRGINLIKVMTAVGMILIVLEDELAQNQAAKERDHRARVEMERYAEIDLSLLSDVNAEAAYQHACEVIVEVSRFSQAALLLRSVEGNFYAAGHAGMEDALVAGLDALGRRVTHDEIERFRQSENIVVEIGNTLQVDIRPLFIPDDPLERLQYFRNHVIPMRMRTGAANGYLFLSGLKQPEQPLQADDLLPLELLVARLTAMREHNGLMQRVARSEKLAGLGQMAAGVAHELNNPLTVVLGYSQILEETLEDHPALEGMSLIRGEAQRMKQIIESMLRFWKPSPVEHVAVSVAEILRDIFQLRRAEFSRRQIDLQLHVADDLPDVDGNRNQLQQMFLQLVNNSLDAFGPDGSGQTKALRVDASHSEDGVRVLISDNGPGFADPNRAFDPFFASKSPRIGAGKGLSVCYAIVRDHGGEITAHNLQPHGAALVIQLPLPRRRQEHELSDEALAH
ncbi:MAG TPA: HAMP domain-containing sensor histidine kinase [Alloacidobacterium sp.]|nr:HAMP domain-containing sensor histidine kinase [Alloacidobacterium sp.]